MPADQLKAALLALTGQQLHGHATTSVDVSALFRSLHSSSGSTTGSEVRRIELEINFRIELSAAIRCSAEGCSRTRTGTGNSKTKSVRALRSVFVRILTS